MPAAAELRARAEAAPRLYARERLTALAAIRDGSSLHAIAKNLTHHPSQIRAWLDEGARVGLEAMLVPPRRPSFPPDAPADIDVVASWIAGVYRPSVGFPLWTVENLTAAVSRNLGVHLSPAGARSIIAAEHARRRPDYYRRLAWKRRGRTWRIRGHRSAYQ